MPAVAGAAQDHILIADLPGKQHAVPIERDKRIFQPDEFLEILRIAQSDGGTTGEIHAPDHIIPPVELHQPGVVGMLRMVIWVAVLIHPRDRSILNIPADTVLAEAHMERGVDVLGIGTEHPHIPVAIRQHGAVEYPGGAGGGVPADDGIAGIPPQGQPVFRPGSVLPRHMGQTVSDDFNAHFHTPFMYRRLYRSVPPDARPTPPSRQY